ncbi:MAG: hypothetical protein IPM92_02565 [Saprospiraceae bacterium]|nr:hypothetical protein [Saprospiraceae bacterium]
MNQQSFHSILILAVLSLAVSLIHCKPKAEEPEQAKIEKVDTSGPEYTSKYICPMFCKGSGSDQPGVCPACGMDYVLNENLDETNEQVEPEAPAEDTTTTQ